jgi:hypothetical protein
MRVISSLTLGPMKLNQFRYFSDARAEDHCNPGKQRHRRAHRYSFVLATWSCIAILVASSAIAAGPHSTRWLQLSPSTSPPPRSYLAMTYDPASGKVIMFGGFDGTGYLNDTWMFDGISWTRIATRLSPPARANAQIAYDTISQKVVLFGGFNGRNYLGDTWLWDGRASRWTQARPAHSPSAVTGPILFPDPVSTYSVDSMGISTRAACDNGMAPTGINCFPRCSLMLALPQQLA